jgi:hypothetical protein
MPVIRVVGVLLGLATLISCGQSQDSRVATPANTAGEPVTSGRDVDDVREGFEAYRSALMDRDGQAAADAVTATTIAKYQEYRDLALTGDESTVKALSIVHRLTVLIVRHRTDVAALKVMDGRALLAHGVEQGWVSQNSVVRLKLGEVTVLGDSASAEATSGGQPAGRFLFAKEQGRWKLDLAKLLTATDPALRAAAKEQGVSENEYIFSLISATSGRTVTDEIWKPLE